LLPFLGREAIPGRADLRAHGAMFIRRARARWNGHHPCRRHRAKEYSLGTFFRIWGEPLGPNRIAGFSGPVLTIIEGVRQPSDFELSTILLSADREVAIEIGFDVDPPRCTLSPGY